MYLGGFAFCRRPSARRHWSVRNKYPQDNTIIVNFKVLQSWLLPLLDCPTDYAKVHFNVFFRKGTYAWLSQEPSWGEFQVDLNKFKSWVMGLIKFYVNGFFLCIDLRCLSLQSIISHFHHPRCLEFTRKKHTSVFSSS